MKRFPFDKQVLKPSKFSCDFNESQIHENYVSVSLIITNDCVASYIHLRDKIRQGETNEDANV